MFGVGIVSTFDVKEVLLIDIWMFFNEGKSLLFVWPGQKFFDDLVQFILTDSAGTLKLVGVKEHHEELLVDGHLHALHLVGGKEGFQEGKVVDFGDWALR